MKHVVRPVWIALADTIVPADIKERCRRSFGYIRQYFLREVGKTFQVAELKIIQTHHTAEHFQEYRNAHTPLLSDWNQIAKIKGCPGYGPESTDLDIFCFNLIAFVRQKLGANNSQIWVILIPVTGKETSGRVTSAIHIRPGGYIVTSEYPSSKGFISGGYGVAHELGHVFGLTHAFGAKRGRLMHWYKEPGESLSNCLLSQEEQWILSRSPFFTEEVI